MRSVGKVMWCSLPLTRDAYTRAASEGPAAAPLRGAGVPGARLLPATGLRAAVYPLYARSKSAFGEADQRRGNGAADPGWSDKIATTGSRVSAA